MAELSLNEIAKLTEEARVKSETLEKYSRLTQAIGQLQGNIEEMGREGRINVNNCPPLDRESPANQGKSQYDISRGNLQSYAMNRDALVVKYPRFFETEEEVA